ncbi:Hypothetical predicted protein [Marmota monax]|uniref:Secreted protein n=1 Tax=Marmota monax TaxID=9995 RepID=A0A5E4BTB0_MARMO|nr:Hypothetical predicted protein [Marmota monax]
MFLVFIVIVLGCIRLLPSARPDWVKSCGADASGRRFQRPDQAHWSPAQGSLVRWTQLTIPSPKRSLPVQEPPAKAKSLKMSSNNDQVVIPML